MCNTDETAGATSGIRICVKLAMRRLAGLLNCCRVPRLQRSSLARLHCGGLPVIPVCYEGFAITARTSQIRGCQRWTLDLLIRRPQGLAALPQL